jgi:serine protease Do
MSAHDTRPDFPSSSSPRRTSRAVLLGTVAAVALGGIAANGLAVDHAARAQTSLSQPDAPAAGPASFAPLVNRVKGAVVAVKVTMTQDADNNDQPSMPQLQPGDPLERFFKQFGGRNGTMPRHEKGMALGSGFIVSADGYVVTNNHVVDHASDMQVTLDDGRTLPVTLVGTDKKTDLALLKIKEKGTYPFVEFGDKSPSVGDWVIAVGNPFGLGGTVTAGIVSARGRDIGSGPYDDFLQIDAPVNRGNSGGPTFDARGAVVGVNTAIFSPSGGSVGIGFAIPAEVARDVVAQLKDHGQVARGWLGVQIQQITPEIAESLGVKSTKGALVASVQTGSPATNAGLKSGDIITGVDDQIVDGPRELSRRIAALGPDKDARITYLREGASRTTGLHLGKLPANDQMARADTSDGNGGQTSLGGLGLSLAPATEIPGAGRQGVVVAEIDPDGAAALKGLRTGDIILDVGGQSVSRPADVSNAIDAAKKDGRKAVLMRIKNAEGTRFVAISTSRAS